MEFPESEYYIALSETLTPDDAYALLERLANDDELRAEIERDPRGAFLKLGVDIGEQLAPSEAVLPEPDEIRRALEAFADERKFSFELMPFGPFTPGRAPFKATLMLAAKANERG